MAGSKSDYLENKFLDLILGGVALSAPASVFIELYTTAPTDAGGGTACSGGAYARVAVTNGTAQWPAASGGAKSNGGTISFAECSTAWGTVVAMGIFDATTSGNLLYWGTLTANKVIAAGDTAKFDVGAIAITED